MAEAKAAGEIILARSDALVGLIVVALGGGLGLLVYADWLPAERHEQGQSYLFFAFASAAFGFGLAIASYLSLRAGRLGTERARKQALAAEIGWAVLSIAFFAIIVIGAISFIGGTYYWIGYEIVRWLTGDLYWFPSDVINLFVLMLAPLIWVAHSKWIRQAEIAGLIFAAIALTAPLAALQVISTLHFLWRFVQVRLMDQSWDPTVWTGGIILGGLHVLAATLLIRFIVRAFRRLRALRRRTIHAP